MLLWRKAEQEEETRLCLTWKILPACPGGRLSLTKLFLSLSGAACPILVQRGQHKWHEIQECSSERIPMDNAVSENSAWILAHGPSVVRGLLPVFMFVWAFWESWAMLQGVSGVSGLLLCSPGSLWNEYLWLDAKTIPRFSFFGQAWVITTSVSCLPCSISNYGCLLSVFQRSLPLPRERKLIMSAQP